MDYKYIEQLLERYWEAETSLQEETILRTFFSRKDRHVEESSDASLQGCRHCGHRPYAG